MKAMVAVVIALCLTLGTFVQIVAAQPWDVPECNDLHWYSTPSQIWKCVMAIGNELFAGWSGWESEGDIWW